MFTGLVTDIGTITAVEPKGDARLTIASHYDMASVEIGASIACAGVCLTVVDKGENGGDGWFKVDVSAETLSKTNLGGWQAGTKVNLERALHVGDELGGHIVAGHVDGVAVLERMEEEGDSIRLTFRAPAALAPFIAPKGSVTLDGVSLTVNDVADDADGCRFGVNIIPHTQEVTTFGNLSPDRAVNLEIDVLARYVARLKEVS